MRKPTDRDPWALCSFRLDGPRGLLQLLHVLLRILLKFRNAIVAAEAERLAFVDVCHLRVDLLLVHHREKIDPKVTYVYEGKTLGFCCDDCIPEFKKDPEKYMKELK